MINPNEAIKAFEEKFNNMSYEEREKYLNRMGFSFESRRATSQIRYSQKKKTAARHATSVSYRLCKEF